MKKKEVWHPTKSKSIMMSFPRAEINKFKSKEEPRWSSYIRTFSAVQISRSNHMFCRQYCFLIYQFRNTNHSVLDFHCFRPAWFRHSGISPGYLGVVPWDGSVRVSRLTFPTPPPCRPSAWRRSSPRPRPPPPAGSSAPPWSAHTCTQPDPYR